MKKIYIIILMLSACYSAISQEISAPMEGRLLLSSNFGELRSGHFHSGIDIKTGGKIGAKVFSVADGYISRIFVSPWGYGKALYITHTNGTTSVYGHLDHFTPEIEKYVMEEQYDRKSFSVDLFPKRNTIAVKKGELIAYSGNSGGSGGPHLHFEIRNTASQRPLNVITLGLIKVYDILPPKILKLHIVEIDSVGDVPTHNVVKTISSDSVNANTVFKVRNNSYFALETTERKNNTNNVMAVYKVTGFLDDKIYYQTAIDSFAFAQTRFVNTYILYEQHKNTRFDVFRTYKSPNNKLPFYTEILNNGMVNLKDTLRHKVEFMVEDDCGNAICMDFQIVRDDTYYPPKPNPVGHVVKWDKSFKNKTGHFNITIPAGTLYESSYVDIKELDTVPKSLSKLYSFGHSMLPLQKSVSISIDADDIEDSLHDKLLIASVNPVTGAMYSAGGGYKYGNVTTNVRSCGTYCIAIDTVAPVIKPLFTDKKPVDKTLEFNISDNLSGISKYDFYIDDKWELFEYDSKRSRMIHTFDPLANLPGKTYKIKGVVKDAKGNQTVYEGTFIK